MFEKIKQHFKAANVQPNASVAMLPDQAQNLGEAELSVRSRQQRLRAQLSQRQTADYFFMIDVVGSCNLRCPSCAVGNYSQTEAKGLMHVDTYQTILEKIRREHPTERIFIHLYNWGEPVLHKQLAKIIDLTRRFGFGCGISCNLNAFPNIAEVVRSAPTYIRISLSGFVNAVYQQSHKRGDINLVKANMHLLRHYLDKFGSDTIVQVGFHVYRGNFPNDFFRMRELCVDLNFIFAPTLASMSPAEKAIRAVDGLKLDPDSESIQGNLVVSMKRRMELLGVARNQYSDCQFRKMSTTINFDGAVPLCCATYERPQIIADNFLTTSQEDLRKRKYAHPFCRECQMRNLDMVYTGAEPQLVEQEAVAVLGNKYGEFLKEWNVSIEPTVNWQGRQLSIQEACDLAMRELTSGAVNNTRALFVLVAQAAPNHAEARFQLGKIAESEGDTGAALEHYKQAIQLYPGFSLYVSQRDSLLANLNALKTRG